MQAYYDLFQCWVRYRVGFNLLSCIYVDVCLSNVNQYYREKRNFYDTSKKQRHVFNYRTDCFKYTSFPNYLPGWPQLTLEIQNSNSIVVSKTNFSLL